MEPDRQVPDLNVRHVKKRLPVQRKVYQPEQNPVLDILVRQRELLLKRHTVVFVNLHNVRDDVLHGPALAVLFVKRVHVDGRHDRGLLIPDQKPLHHHTVVLLHAPQHGLMPFSQLFFYLPGNLRAKFLKTFHGKYTPDSLGSFHNFDVSPCAHGDICGERPSPPAIRKQKKKSCR